MKYLKHLLCTVLMLFLLVPGAAASESKGGGVDLQGILWGHIKDSYEWHVTNIGDKPVIINLPVIVKTSDGWYTGWAEDFAEEPIEKGPHAGYRVRTIRICSLLQKVTTNVGLLNYNRMGRKYDLWTSQSPSRCVYFSLMQSFLCCVF